jgi:hypothetical protein
MLILMDENLLSKKLKQPFLRSSFDVYNVDDMGWRGFKDKEILDLAEKYPKVLRIVILDTRSTRPDYLLPMMEKINNFVLSLSIGEVVSINDMGEIKRDFL